MKAEARLCAIVDVDIAQKAGWAPADLAAAYVSGGARFLQLRAKSLAGSPLLELTRRVRELTQAAGATLILNDRPDIAKIAGADGVHVGQTDIAPAGVRVILGDQTIVGLSTHTDRQVERAVTEPVSYVAIGPVFETSTTATGYSAVGLQGVRRAAALTKPRGLGLIAIGGMTVDRAVEAMHAGATGVAVITHLLESHDPEARTREYLARLREVGGV